jgi:hypothetical protein
MTLHQLAGVLSENRRYAEATQLASTALDTRRKVLPTGHRDIGLSLQRLGAIALREGKVASAEAQLRQALEVLRLSYEEGDWRLSNCARLWGECALKQGDCARAESLLVPASEVLLSSKALNARDKRGVVEAMIALYDSLGNAAEVSRWRETLAALADETAE